jgi:hypothetical protein
LCQTYYENDERKHQQQMNGSAKGVTADHSQSPHDEQNEENPKHLHSTSAHLDAKGAVESWLQANHPFTVGHHNAVCLPQHALAAISLKLKHLQRKLLNGE